MRFSPGEVEQRRGSWMNGKVVCWDDVRGFGFLCHADCLDDIFFHAKDFTGDRKLLVSGAMVEFSLGNRKGKAVACNVRLLKSEAVAEDRVRAVLGNSNSPSREHADA